MHPPLSLRSPLSSSPTGVFPRDYAIHFLQRSYQARTPTKHWTNNLNNHLVMGNNTKYYALVSWRSQRKRPWPWEANAWWVDGQRPTKPFVPWSCLWLLVLVTCSSLYDTELNSTVAKMATKEKRSEINDRKTGHTEVQVRLQYYCFTCKGKMLQSQIGTTEVNKTK